MTALRHAINQRNERLVQLLIRAGADVNMNSRIARTGINEDYRHAISPLELAASTGNSEIFQALIDGNASLGCDALSRTYILYQATKCNNSSIVKYLLDAKLRNINIDIITIGFRYNAFGLR